jgi:hypothetical protein
MMNNAIMENAKIGLYDGCKNAVKLAQEVRHARSYMRPSPPPTRPPLVWALWNCVVRVLTALNAWLLSRGSVRSWLPPNQRRARARAPSVPPPLPHAAEAERGGTRHAPSAAAHRRHVTHRHHSPDQSAMRVVGAPVLTRGRDERT